MIMTKQEILTYLFEHKDEFYKKFSITKLGLFGSYARGDATEESDIAREKYLKPLARKDICRV